MTKPSDVPPETRDQLLQRWRKLRDDLDACNLKRENYWKELTDLEALLMVVK